MDDDLYSELSQILALDTFSRCISDTEGRAVYEHFCENSLDIPPDILSRLGVMRPIAPDQWMTSQGHEFACDWSPAQPLVLKRHAGAPSVFDLIVAVCMLVEWNGPSMPDGLRDLASLPPEAFPTLDLNDDRRFNTDPQRTFCRLVFRKAADPLERLGLGQWTDSGRFELISPLLGNSPIDLADTYSETRHLTAQRLGGVQVLFPPE